MIQFFKNNISQNKGVDRVFFLIGQSNCDGRGELVDLAPPLDVKIPRSKVSVDGGDWFDLEQGNASRTNQVGPILNLAYNLSLLYPDDNNYFVIHAVGGTSLFGNWKSGGNMRNDATISYITSTNTLKNPVCQGIFWMQGESDCDVEVEADSYEVGEIDLISYFKDLTKCDVFVSGNIGSIIGFPYLSTVQGAKDNNQTNSLTNGLVDTSLYPLKGDDLHFTTDGANSLGQAFYDLFVLNN